MVSSSSQALVGLLSLLTAPFASAQTCTPCDDVHFFLARGNNEPYPGRQGALVAATCDGLSSCGYEDLIYSALFTDLSCQTTYDGAVAGISQMTDYAERCPNSKMILAGYSQGAQIVTDILGGGGGVSFNGCVQPPTPALDRSTSPGNRLSAVIAFGNTRHTANQPYNYGNGSSYDGLFPRSGAMLTNLDAYASITRDWCLETDPICADNQTNAEVSVHLGYYNVYSNDAAAWIKSVASITDDSTRTTAIPTSVSGTAQNYATIGTQTPSGTVSTVATIVTPVTCGSTLTPALAAATTSGSPSTVLNGTKSVVTMTTSQPMVGLNSTLTTATLSSTGAFSFPAGTTTSGAFSFPAGTSSGASTASASIASITPGSGASDSHASNLGLVALLALLPAIVI